MAFLSHPKLLSSCVQSKVRGRGVAVLSLENSRDVFSLNRNFQESFF